MLQVGKIFTVSVKQQQHEIRGRHITPPEIWLADQRSNFAGAQHWRAGLAAVVAGRPGASRAPLVTRKAALLCSIQVIGTFPEVVASVQLN